MAVEVKRKNVISNFFNSIITFFKEIKAEFKRITWASKENTKKSFFATLIFVFIWVAITGVLDNGFRLLFDNIILK